MGDNDRRSTEAPADHSADSGSTTASVDAAKTLAIGGIVLAMVVGGVFVIKKVKERRA